MKTESVKASDIKKQWLLIDATDQTLGRISSQIAGLLRGKHKPSFVPHLDCGDFVVVVNAEKVKLTGNKLKAKIYHHHTSYIGGIKARRAEDVLSSHPERIIETAVKGMLPKTKLGREVFKNLRVFKGTEHKHGAQNPVPAASRTQVAQ